MAIERKIQCDICDNSMIEKTQGEGFQGWGALQGIALNGSDNPTLCPECLAKVATFIDEELKNGMD